MSLTIQNGDAEAILDQVYSRISREISPGDGMFRGDEDHYFSVTKSALRAIYRAILLAGRSTPQRILDFACGHGRVTRGLRAAFPGAYILACDLDRKGVDFCSQAFQAEPCNSSRNLAEIRLGGQFDLIWCGSLLTHLREGDSRAFLDLFIDHLTAENGLLVCTFHGRYSVYRQKHLKPYVDEDTFREIQAGYEQRGYGFAPYTPDAPTYGLSIAKPSWVLGCIERHSDVRILAYTERGWAQHQDVLAIVKRPVEGLQ